jgi:hypothetical protein
MTTRDPGSDAEPDGAAAVARIMRRAARDVFAETGDVRWTDVLDALAGVAETEAAGGEV